MAIAKGLAAAFAVLDDDAQAQFFCEVARIAEAWREANPNSLGPSYQWFQIGRHLGTCECSTEAGRDMVRDIAAAMDEALAQKRVVD